MNGKLKSSSAEQTIAMKGQLGNFDRPWIMGIVNLTPDSFSDGGQYQTPRAAAERAEYLVSQGADVLDLGAVSSRPGAAEVGEGEELHRLLPALEAVRKALPLVPLSIDTWRASVARQALEAGAHLVNDITSGLGDPEMFGTVAKAGAPLILMHMQGNPATMQSDPRYGDVVDDIALFFSERLSSARAAGINDLIIDPGFGFGKSREHNFMLAGRLGEFKMFDVPILVGISRKSMLQQVTNQLPMGTENAESALHLHLLKAGARILRVHEPRPAHDAIRIFNALEAVVNSF